MTRHLQSNVHQVDLGEFKIGRCSEIFQATLSSCAGIVFIWAKGGDGTAHCLLPEPPSSIGMIGAGYVSKAVPSLLPLMVIKESDYSVARMIRAGGASIFPARSANSGVGQQTIAAAEKQHVDLTCR